MKSCHIDHFTVNRVTLNILIALDRDAEEQVTFTALTTYLRRTETQGYTASREELICIFVVMMRNKCDVLLLD